MAKFILERDNPTPLFITLDSISERFFEPSQEYSPPQTKIILTRLKTQINNNNDLEKTNTVTCLQSFVSGDINQGWSHNTVTMHEGLEKGVYIAFY